MMEKSLDPRLRVLRQADMRDKIVLIRVDHNVVKNGRIKDPYRIDATLGTLYAVVEAGGRPILMTHVGRPKDKKTGAIRCLEGDSVRAIAGYLERKLPVTIATPEFACDPGRGIVRMDGSLAPLLDSLKKRRIGMIYLPNTRWFQGEESSGPERGTFVRELASIADLFVNDAFGSWQAHASTFDIAHALPSYAGVLLQKELSNLHGVLEPQRPFVAVIAGAKYDTKIGPLKSLYERVDHLILGGLMYGTYLSAKFAVPVAGVSEQDRELAMELVELDRDAGKILEMTHVVESDTMEGRDEARCRTITTEELARRESCGYLLDVAPRSLDTPMVKEVLDSAGTVFTNAVMGFMPFFSEGSEALYRRIASNKTAIKLFGGGDTLQELKNLCPGVYLEGLDDPRTYYFTGGGSVLAALEQGGAYHLKPVQALLD